MISSEAIDAFNTRLTVTINSIKTMTIHQQDQVKATGSEAEALLKNRQLALFIHTTKFEILDEIAGIMGHTQDDNNRRISLANKLAGLDSFITVLRRAVHMKELVVKHQTAPAKTKEESEYL